MLTAQNSWSSTKGLPNGRWGVPLKAFRSWKNWVTVGRSWEKWEVVKCWNQWGFYQGTSLDLCSQWPTVRGGKFCNFYLIFLCLRSFFDFLYQIFYKIFSLASPGLYLHARPNFPWRWPRATNLWERKVNFCAFIEKIFQHR